MPFVFRLHTSISRLPVFYERLSHEVKNRQIVKAHKSLWFLLSSCLIFSPLRFLFFFSFMVNLPSSATISPPLLLLSPPSKPLRPSFPPPLLYLAATFQRLSQSLRCVLKKIYISIFSSCIVHSSSFSLAPLLCLLYNPWNPPPPPSFSPSPFTFFPDFLWRLKESGDPLSWQRERRWRHSRHDTPASALV